MHVRRLVSPAVLAVLSFIAETPAFAGGQFKRFPDTISPDGIYALAWGPAEDPLQDPAEMVEVPYDDEAFDEANRKRDAANYLVEVATHKVVAIVPGFEYWRGPGGHKNRGGIEIGWSPDARSALAVSAARWGSESVVWIEPQTGKIVEVQDQLHKSFHGVLRKTEPEFAEVGDIAFSHVVIPQPGVLILHASGTIPKEQNTSEYQLKFKVTGSGEKVQFHLQSSRRLKEYASSYNKDPEAELNKVYNRLRAKLAPARGDTLRDEQTNWLKLREGIINDNCRADFTEHRIVELRTRLELE